MIGGDSRLGNHSDGGGGGGLLFLVLEPASLFPLTALDAISLLFLALTLSPLPPLPLFLLRQLLIASKGSGFSCLAACGRGEGVGQQQCASPPLLAGLLLLEAPKLLNVAAGQMLRAEGPPL